ncbi:MAG: hypothetical protein IPJ03_05700 [Ignavibacteriales bacterium]|nr:hypothetical protein [Ignavibacteriales bacterium]
MRSGRSPVRIRQLARKGERGRGRASRSNREGHSLDSGSWLGREKEERVEHPDPIGKVTDRIPAVGSKGRKGKGWSIPMRSGRSLIGIRQLILKTHFLIPITS